MPGTMSMADLVTDLKASIKDAADVFTADADADFERHLNHAALDFHRARPRTLVGELTLVADQSNYPAPAGLLMSKAPLWGTAEKRRIKHWERHYPGQLPRLHMTRAADHSKELWLDPAPTAEQITLLGSAYKFFYFAAHAIGVDAADTTIAAEDRNLLLVRAQAEAMKEIAARNSKKPVMLRDGMTGTPRNATPAALADWLMDQFERQAA